MFIRNIKNILSPAGVIVGALIVIVGYVTQARDVVSWGWPIWAWQALGAGIFFISVIAILYKHQKDINSLKPLDEGSLNKTKQAQVRDKRLIDDLGWLPDKVDDIYNNPTRYLQSRLTKVFLSSPTEIGLVIEWFNFSFYDLKFESVSGETSMGEISFDFESLGHQITLVGETSISMFSPCKCTCHLQIVDLKKLDQFNDAIQKNKPLNWRLNLNTKLSTIGYRDRTFTAQTFQEIIIVPSRN